MIVRNEAALLAACIESAAAVVNEVCIVDTGSADETPDLARRLGARVSAFPWDDDFAAARNASLDKCTGDWILIVDADERLASEDVDELRRVAEGPVDCAYRMMTRNYVHPAGVSEFRPCAPDDAHAQGFPGWFPSWKVRFFPNGVGARYEGRVHELVRPSLERAGLAILDCPVTILHYPMLRDVSRVLAKRRMYVELGRRKVEDEPDNPKAYAELGHQYAELGEYGAAAAAYREALKRAPHDAGLLKDLGGVLHMTGRADAALQALDLAVRTDPTLAEAWRNLGVVHAARACWRDAEVCFARALELAPDWAEGHRYLGIALEHVGRLQEAVDEARQAVLSCPASPEALDLYARQMTQLGRQDDAWAFIEEHAARLRPNPAVAAIMERLSARGKVTDTGSA
ncbi:MAG TPA: glycosyltransferase [Candidatus Hydrogenedentes bacterium]|nr:glycosyltransferase [Candidatus Hydrogenedentota bacterium]